MQIGQFGIPGQTSALFSATNEFLWGGDLSRIEVLMLGGVVDGTARDAGSVNTAVLRPGLIMGRVEATGKLKQFDPSATDGTQVPWGILPVELWVNDIGGTDAERVCPIVVRAPVKAGNLRILGASMIGHAGEYLARRQLAQNGCRFDDDVTNTLAGLVQRVTSKATNYTVVATDNGTLFYAITADATFTLPAIKQGLEFEFLRASDHELVVASAEGDNMIVGNDLSADSITFTTTGEQIGARIKVKVISVGGVLKWLPELPYTPFGTGTATLTFGIAT